MPGLVPGVTVPVPLTLPLIVPEPPRKPGLVTVVFEVIEPLTSSVPPLTAVAPVYVLAPPSVCVPVPVLVKETVPAAVLDAAGKTARPVAVADDQFTALPALPMLTVPFPDSPPIVCTVPGVLEWARSRTPGLVTVTSPVCGSLLLP